MELNIEFNLLDKDGAEIFRQIFADVDNITILRKNICQSYADCIVTAGQSYGFMDGGVDGAINNLLSSSSIERIDVKVRRQITRDFYCEQPVGTCILIKTENPYIKWLAHAPTMIVPINVSNSLNAYLAFRSVLVSILKHNENNTEKIKYVVTPSFCTGAGEMPYERSAKQMRAAYESVVSPQDTYDWKKTWSNHRKLLSL